MHRLFLLLIITLVSCESVTHDEQAEEEIVKLARKRSKAVVDGDIVTLDQILSDDFTYVNISGQLLSRKAYLEGQVSLGSSNSRWISQTMDSITVKVIDATALITFRVNDRFIYDSVEYSNFCRSTFLYKQDTERNWKCVMGHTTKISTE